MEIVEQEIWKEIFHLDKRYFISNTGKIKLLNTNTDGIIEEKLLRTKINKKSNTIYIHLRKNNQTIKLSVGILVAKAFVENPHQSKVIKYKDGNTLNNMSTNIEWLKKYIILRCRKCQKEFKKNGIIYRNTVKKHNRKDFFCSWHCRSTCLDELSPFRRILIDAKSRARQRELNFNLTLECLKKIWDKQDGTCPYTGIKMTLAFVNKFLERKPNRASIDRIDSSLGYTEDNIEFVCLSVNYGKSDFSQKEVKDFYKQIIDNASKPDASLIISS